MGKVYRVVGPPGTGKTTYLTHQITAAAEKYGRNGVVVASFTNTAAQELTARNPELQGVGTLHHHAFSAIGHRKVAESMIADFSVKHPQYKITSTHKPSAVDTGLDPVATKTSGDELLAKLNLLRARMVKYEMWPENVKKFDRAWSAWKYEKDCVDFTDMLDIALRESSHAPMDPGVIFIDESQDNSPLGHALAMKWGRRCDRLVMSGDADQAIFSFAGADPSVMMGEVDEERSLSQSYRVPGAVHEYARRWVKQIRTRNDYEYKPRPEPGFLKRAHYNIQMADMLAGDIEKYTAEGKSVMVLASCGYMLNPIITTMRERGILYSNRWRPSNGAWNPIHTFDDDSDRMSLTDRLLNFLAPCYEVWGDKKHLWSADEFASWATLIRSEAGISRGMKKTLKEIEGGEMIDFRYVSEFFGELSDFWPMFETFTKEGALSWISQALTVPKQRQARYPLKVIEKYNTDLEPKVTVGTIHSVKGAEADVVIVAPDISMSGMQEYAGGSTQRDNVMRLFYVALTRAREGLILCQQSGSSAVRWI